MPGRTWTEEQKAEKSKAVSLFWREHGHPMQGRKHNDDTKLAMKKKKHRPPILGHCILCSRPLYSRESAKRGMGDFCAGLK